MKIPIQFQHHFQNAYVVRNLDVASAGFGDCFGISKWHVMAMPAGGPVSRIGLAYVQDLMIELIEPVPSEDSIYRDWIPDSDEAARFHHHGFLIADEEEFRDAAAQFEKAGCRAALAGTVGDIIDYYYADTVALLGHYSELVHLRPAGRDFFSQVPRQ